MASIGSIGVSTAVPAESVAGRPAQPCNPVGADTREAAAARIDARWQNLKEGKRPSKNYRKDTSDTWDLKKGFIQPVDEPSDLDHALAEASAGIHRLRVESARLSEELLKRSDGPEPTPAPSGKALDAPTWQAQLRAVTLPTRCHGWEDSISTSCSNVANEYQLSPTWQEKYHLSPTWQEKIDSLSRTERIALLEAGVEAAAAEEGNILRPRVVRGKVPMREDGILEAATKRGLLERTGATTADGQQEYRLADQPREEERRMLRRRPYGPATAAGTDSEKPSPKLDDSAAPTDSLDDEAWIEKRRAGRKARIVMRKGEREMHWPSLPYTRADVTWPPFKEYHNKIVVPAPQTEIIDAPLPEYLKGGSRLCRLARQGHWGSLLGKPTERLTVSDKLEVQEPHYR